MNTIDMRTDTSSRPTEAMRVAMKEASVGNDGYGEDPTVNRLETMASQMLGKEDGLYVPSGMMGNMLGIMANVEAGKAALVGRWTHIALSESFGLSRLGGIRCIEVEELPNGNLDIDDTKELLTRLNASEGIDLISLENTHNLVGGTAMSRDDMESYLKIARTYGLKTHLDGARIFNASVALNVDVKELTQDVDTVTFCLSKGLCAPVGSILCSDGETIAKARYLRKMMGGQMRQAGVIAAAGIVALEQMIQPLAEDHQKACLLADGLASLEGLSLDLSRVQTNLVIADVAGLGITAKDFCKKMQDKGVQIIAITPHLVRFALYKDITWNDVHYALDAVKQVVSEVIDYSPVI